MTVPITTAVHECVFFWGGVGGVKQNALPRFFGRASELEKPQAISAQSSLFRSLGLARTLLLYISPSTFFAIPGLCV